jgi:hypothetical protein
MKTHKHSFIRFFIDITITLILVLGLMSPVILVMSLKIKDLNLKAEIIKAVAGSHTEKK